MVLDIALPSALFGLLRPREFDPEMAASVAAGNGFEYTKEMRQLLTVWGEMCLPPYFPRFFQSADGVRGGIFETPVDRPLGREPEEEVREFIGRIRDTIRPSY